MSRIRSIALERLVIILLVGLNQLNGIPTLVLGPGTVHTHRFQKMFSNLKQWIQTLQPFLMWSKSSYIYFYVYHIYFQISHTAILASTLAGLENPTVF